MRPFYPRSFDIDASLATNWPFMQANSLVQRCVPISAFPPIADITSIADWLADPLFLDQMRSMHLDDQIRRYFGTSNLAAVPQEALDAGIEHMKVDLGLTKDRGERFALWALLHTLGSAPDLDVAFESEAEREAARNFMDLLQGESGA